MSNNTNLSKLANVLDDGSSGQFLKSTGSGGVVFSPAGVTVYPTINAMTDVANPSAGDLAYVTANAGLYQNNGNGWYKIATVNTTPAITSVQDASSGTTPFDLSTSGTATVITVTASDADEGTTLTYSHSVTSGSLNGTTVTQGTGASANVFTVTPHASQPATFSLTFNVTDSTNTAQSVNSFTLSFSMTQQAKLTASDADSFDAFGCSVAISGSTAIVGAREEDTSGTYAGSAYIYTRSGTTWSQQQKIQASNAETYDYFGFSVAVDGDTAVATATHEDTSVANGGAAYVFTRSGSTWSQQAMLTASDAQSNDQLGHACAIDGDTVAASAAYEDTGGSDAGAVYVWVRSGTTWSQQQKIQGSNTGTADQFGSAVAISGNTLVVGASQEDTTGTNAGAVYVFTRSGTTWSQQQMFQSSDVAAGDFFGSSLDIDGDNIIVGAPSKASSVGAAYVFTRSGTTWSQQTKLTDSNGGAGDSFGRSVAIDGDTALVGAILEDTTGSNAGSVFEFGRSGTTWSQRAQLQPSDVAANDNFGDRLALDNGYAVIASPYDDDNSADSGSAYIFT